MYLLRMHVTACVRRHSIYRMYYTLYYTMRTAITKTKTTNGLEYFLQEVFVIRKYSVLFVWSRSSRIHQLELTLVCYVSRYCWLCPTLAKFESLNMFSHNQLAKFCLLVVLFMCMCISIGEYKLKKCFVRRIHEFLAFGALEGEF